MKQPFALIGGSLNQESIPFHIWNLMLIQSSHFFDWFFTKKFSRLVFKLKDWDSMKLVENCCEVSQERKLKNKPVLFLLSAFQTTDFMGLS